MGKYKFWSEQLGIDISAPIQHETSLPSSYAYNLVNSHLQKNGVTVRELEDGVTVHMQDMNTLEKYTIAVAVSMELLVNTRKVE